MALHEKLDKLRTDEVEKLLIQQKEQIELLTELLTTFRASRQSVGDA